MENQVIPAKAKPVYRRMLIRFVIRKVRTNQLGQCPLNVRVTIDGVKATEFSAHVSVSPLKWDSKRQFIEEDEAGNKKLAEIKAGLEEVYQEYRRSKINPTAAHVVAKYMNPENDDLQWSIKRLAETHLKDLAIRGRAGATIVRYERIYRYFIEFSKVHYVSEVKKAHVRTFWNYLKEKGYSTDYCNKMIQCLYGLFECAILNEVIEHNPVRGIKLSWENKLDLTSLDAEELDALKNTAWSPRLQRVADSFLFMCYTGLHITDYVQLTDENIKSNLKVKWIEYDRQKTGKPAVIPLHPVASGIIRKYGSISRLPRISCQKSNDYLKMIAERIGTTKTLTNKVARKTFTDMSINQRGMSFESVAAMLGHVSTKFVKVYGKVKHHRIISEWKA